ncbi:hypothetical protein HPG69_010611 [Diceros bicornis minor]|uniref:Uncharacterized protein n=1 Tax=Diceros bicornis minor TaxID=77932 RepID=A0A7J7FGF8_DICBM|nr:hypothetical protein HPG69_010611 [Diceros bicornis minor]
MTVKLTIQIRQAQIEVAPSASALIIEVLKELPRDRKKQKSIKHSGSTMQHQSLARELSGTIKRSWGLPSRWAAMLMLPPSRHLRSHQQWCGGMPS